MQTHTITIDDTGHDASADCEQIIDLHNRRIKLLGLTAERADEFGVDGDLGKSDGGFSKLTIYTPDRNLSPWQEMGFRHEADISGYFADGSDAALLARYIDPERGRDPQALAQDAVVAACAELELREAKLPLGWSSRVATKQDVEMLSQLLRDTFPDYPSPTDPASLANQIQVGSHHFRLLFDPDGELGAAASLELDHQRKSAELTDCATRPVHRGRGLMTAMLRELELDAVNEYGIRDLYTIARATQPGINRAFARRGFRYTGRLVNNCRMPGGWESMNVWCKRA